MKIVLKLLNTLNKSIRHAPSVIVTIILFCAEAILKHLLSLLAKSQVRKKTNWEELFKVKENDLPMKFHPPLED